MDSGMQKIKTLKDKEKELLEQVLTKTDWDLEKASRLLKIPLPQVKKKIGEHGMKRSKPSTY
jgi:DNA-binding NtrC family response regulator